MSKQPTSVSRANIAITLGDPAGIGPEIVAAGWLACSPQARKRLVIFSDEENIERGFAALNRTMPPDIQLAPLPKKYPGISFNQPTKHSAAFQVEALETAVKAVVEEGYGGIVTAPIHKANAASAGFAFPGHTEFLAHSAGLSPSDVAMCFIGKRFRIVLATTHVPLVSVPKHISTDSIVSTARLAIDSLVHKFGFDRLRVAVLGLNPHAGEGGKFGNEETEIIGPAVAQLVASIEKNPMPVPITIDGPLPADTAFREPYDLFVAMYHDQALIPVKLVDFQHAVNVTLGLPFVRTSPDHGVAYSIAGTGQADPKPMKSAIETALIMTNSGVGL